MKLTTEPGALAGAVKFAARALTARAAYPILSGLKITADPDGTVEVSAFDYETSARARIGAEVSEPGTVLTPGRLLAEIAALLPRQPAELAGDGAALALACGSTRYRLHLLPLDGYPALPELGRLVAACDTDETSARKRAAESGAEPFTTICGGFFGRLKALRKSAMSCGLMGATPSSPMVTPDPLMPAL